MTAQATRWTGSCTRCHQERELETRHTHGERALCDRCAVLPPVIDLTAVPSMVTGDKRRIEIELAAFSTWKVLKRQEGTAPELLGLILDHNRVRCSPPIPDDEVAVIVAAAVEVRG